jgi:hypothetical protein
MPSDQQRQMGVSYRLTAGGRSRSDPRPVPLVVDLDDAVMRLISRCASALRLLASCAGPLLKQDVLETPELQRLAVTHVHDLVALVLGATRDAGDVAHGRGAARALRAPRRRSCREQQHPSLSIDRSRSISGDAAPLQKLFETDGATFSFSARAGVSPAPIAC